MNGSKLLNERKELFKKTSKLVFNSKWSRDRFLEGFNELDIYSDKLTVLYQSAKKFKINFKNKKKIISFVGKLNRAKGSNIYGNAIIKILNKFH